MKAREVAYAEIQAEAEIQEQANTVLIDTTPQPAAPASLPEPKKTIQVDASTGEVLEPQAAPAAKPTSRKAAPEQWDVAEPDFKWTFGPLPAAAAETPIGYPTAKPRCCLMLASR